MARKKQYDFFKAIAQLADNTHQAAEIFAVLVQNYDPATLIADSEKIHILEKDSDQVITELTNELYDAFSEETDLLTIIKWKEIYDKFEETINASEDAVDIIDGMIIKNS